MKYFISFLSIKQTVTTNQQKGNTNYESKIIVKESARHRRNKGAVEKD